MLSSSGMLYHVVCLIKTDILEEPSFRLQCHNYTQCDILLIDVFLDFVLGNLFNEAAILSSIHHL